MLGLPLISVRGKPWEGIIWKPRRKPQSRTGDVGWYNEQQGLGKRGIMKSSPSQDQQWPELGATQEWWILIFYLLPIAIAMVAVADTLGALHHTPQPKLSSHWQCLPQACSHHSHFLLFFLRVFSSSGFIVGASHREHSHKGDNVLPLTFNYWLTRANGPMPHPFL